MELEGPPKFPMTLGMKIGLFGSVGLVVVLVAVYLVYRLVFAPPSFPSPSGKYKAERITIWGDADYTKIVEKAKDLPGDGADDVAAAMKKFDRLRSEIADRRRNGGTESDLVSQLAAMAANEDELDAGKVPPFVCAAELIAAGDKKDFTSTKLLDMGELDWRPPAEMTTLDNIGIAAGLEATIAAKRGDTAKAESMCRGLILVGRRLTESQERVWVQLKGWEMQMQAAKSLSAVLEKTSAEKSKAAMDYANAAYKTFLRANRENFGPLCRKLNDWYVGDLAMIAKDHPDRAWRVEALLSLGMARLNKSGAAHNKAVLAYLDKVAKSDDPWIAAAAKWSRDLELPVYRSQVSERSR